MSLKTIRLAVLAVGLASSPSWAQTLEVLHHFTEATSGKNPEATLTVGPDGDLYGTTTVGGANDAGTLFKVSTAGTFTPLGNFDPATTGKYPHARLVNVGDGRLYGATMANQNIAGSPPGTVYQYDPLSGLAPVFPLTGAQNTPARPVALVSSEPDVLHVLCDNSPGVWRVPLDGSPRTVSYYVGDGSFPASLVRGKDGFLYGTQVGGGPDAVGRLFRLNADGSNYTILHTCLDDDGRGYTPEGAMVQAPDGNFYGTMVENNLGGGVIYRLTPPGTQGGAAQYTVIHSFKDLRYPYGDLTLASDGYLYGTTSTSYQTGGSGIFRIKPNGTGYKTVYIFSKKLTPPFYPEGRDVLGGLVQGSDGNLYGTAWRGGQNDVGTVFRLKLKLAPPPINRSPIAVDDSIFSDGNGPVSINVLGNDYDSDSDALTVKVIQAPSHGTATVQSTGAILYTPNNSYDNQDSLVYKITDGRGGSSIAFVNISDNTPLGLETGAYTGLVYSDVATDKEAPAGQISLNILPTGKFSGVLSVQRKRFTLRGTFASNGTSVLKLKVPVLGVTTLHLSAKVASGTNGGLPAVQATLFGATGAVWTGPALGNLAGPTTKTTFTVLLGNDPANVKLPKGHGYGSMTILPTGVVTARGKLGDGTAFSWGSHVTASTTHSSMVPVFSKPLTNAVAGGLLNIPNDSLLQGELIWNRGIGSSKKPYADGFYGKISAKAARFTPPARTAPVLADTQGSITLSELPVLTPASGGYTLAGTRVTVSGNLRSLSINRSTGLVVGKMIVDRKTRAFTGVIDQSNSTGVGQVNIGGVTAKMVLTP